MSRRDRGARGTAVARDAAMLRNAKASRYMLIRYLAAILFFANMYWCFALLGDHRAVLALPLLDMALCVVVTGEAVWIVTTDREFMGLSHRLLAGSSALPVIEISITLAAGKGALFPFLRDPVAGIACCAIALLLKALLFRKIVLVRDRRDRRYAYCARLAERTDESKVG